VRRFKFKFNYLRGETSVAYSAFEGSLLRVTPVVNFQRGLAREGLVAEFTRSVPTYCNKL